MNDRIYEVETKENSGYKGLTVGASVLEPGQQFSESQWPYGHEALEKTVKAKRCKVVSGKTENKKAPKGDDK